MIVFILSRCFPFVFGAYKISGAQELALAEFRRENDLTEEHHLQALQQLRISKQDYNKFCEAGREYAGGECTAAGATIA